MIVDIWQGSTFCETLKDISPSLSLFLIQKIQNHKVKPITLFLGYLSPALQSYKDLINKFGERGLEREGRE